MPSDKGQPVKSLRQDIQAGQFTTVDYILYSIYPATLVLGFCFSLGHSSSYFAHSHNIFNLVFVKNGWAWTSLVFAAHIIRLPVSTQRQRQAVTRWALATLLWLLVTQWAFGAPLTDRTMIWSGGVCQLAEDSIGRTDGLTEQVALLTNKACKEANGRWKGGHDLSGHVFILSHSSLFIWYEILPLLLEESPLMSDQVSFFAYGLLAGWWWMLLMTAAYFHTWKEKLTGLVAGTIGWLFVYKVSPRYAALSYIIGQPSI